jgi:type IV secretory pathway TraG/TraD family ATPase VirD4
MLYSEENNIEINQVEGNEAIMKNIKEKAKTHVINYCTIPHVIAICLNENLERTLDMLSTDIETKGLISTINTALKNKAGEQLAGVVSSLQTPVSKLNTKEIFWVLSGNDFDLDLNNIKNPKSLIIGNDSTLADSLSPVISLILTVVLKLLNQKNKLPSIVLLDEGPTIYIPKLEQTPATGRSNFVSVVFGAQDFSQMKDKYGQEKMDAILANLGNQFFGRVSHKTTAEYISALLGKEEKTVVNFSSSSTQGAKDDSANFSTSQQTQERSTLKPQHILNFEQGEFACITPESINGFCRAKIKVDLKYSPEKIYAHSVGIFDKENFIQIHKEAEIFLSQYEKENLAQMQMQNNKLTDQENYVSEWLAKKE